MEGVVVPVSLFLMVFAIVYVYYTTRNKERMALIEKGADPGLFKSEPRETRYSTFKWGLFMIGLAIGVFLGAILDEYTKLNDEAVYFASILVCGGIALVLAYLLRNKLEKKTVPAEQ